MKNLDLFKRVLNKKTEEPFIIAEVGQAHEGSLGQALSFIDVAADAGANAIKFQTHFASEESSKFDDFRINAFPQDKNRTDYWKRMEFIPEQWKLLAKRAKERNIVFLSSPFSNLAVETLLNCDIEAWKIASGELQNYPMIDKIINTNKPVLISTGMSSWLEIDEIYKYTHGRSRVLFQCTSSYPSQPENIGLNNIELMKKRYKDCVIGLSDHSGDIYASMSAYMLGARVFEVHVTWSKNMFGPDTTSSLTMQELASLVNYLQLQNRLISSPTDKDVLSKNKTELAKLFGRSIYARKNILMGQKIREKDLAYLKPSKGINAKFYKSVINKYAKKNITAGNAIFESDLEK